jgi:predicted DNA-binding transcriptional regulator YafY
LLPVINYKINEEKTRKQNPDNLSVWCTDKNQWRSFRIANVQKITPIPKTHTITLEEDPETGDLVIPFTDEILQEAGWKEGDTIEWIDNKDGSWSLVKQQDETAK